MIKHALILVSSLIMATAANAHPHTDIKQQVLLSVGLQTTNFNIRIMPSYTGGQDIWYQIDTNKDKHISEKEAQAFAERVFDLSVMEMNGVPVKLSNRLANVPKYEDVVSGVGAIKVSANGYYDIKTDADEEHKLIIEMHFEDFSHDWHIQPFYYKKFNEAMNNKSIQRLEGGHRLELTFYK